ncbi:MAG: DUF3794 domain-containing protein [Clostridia bacterium]|nr:DUF3794 domain-containing protein [Clostridia bacterium]
MSITFEKESNEIYEQHYEGFCQENIEDEITLPDYCPEIIKICKTSARVYVTETRIIEKQCIIRGKISFTVLYSSSIANKIRSFIHQKEFTHTFMMEEECDNPQIRVKIVPEYVNSKALSRKKITFKSIISIAVKVCCKKTTENLKCIEKNHICQNKKTIKSTDTISFCEKNVTISDEIYIDKHFPDIEEIIMTKGILKIVDKKSLQNKIIIKGNVELNILYNSSDSDDIIVYKCDMPCGQIIDIEGASDELESVVEGDINDISFELFDDETGETRILKADINLNLKCEIMKNREMEILCDIFSYNSEIDCKYKKLHNEYIHSKINEIKNLQADISFDNRIEKISYIYGESKIEKVKIENNNILINGSVDVSVIYISSENTVEVQSKNIPFEHMIIVDNCKNLSRLRANSKVVNISFSIVSDNKINCMLDISIEGYIYCGNKYKVLCDAEELSDVGITEKHSMVLYFAQKNEKIWDIAKKFKADKDNIIRYNNLSKDIIDADNMIVIPVN